MVTHQRCGLLVVEALAQSTQDLAICQTYWGFEAASAIERPLPIFLLF